MPENIIKTKGPLKTASPEVGGTNIYKTPVIGIVKDNIDPTRSGRIKVFIGEPGAKNSNVATSWLTVSYMSSFFGKVIPTAGQTGLGTYKENPSSYGQWQSPPDIGTKVICIFVNGDPNFGFYIGGIPEPDALQMVPAIGAVDNVVTNSGEANSYGGATRLPVTNINTNDRKTADSNEYNNTARPVHSYTASVMFQQGIIRDPVRGPISSSASREPASRVGWGVSTPGRPIYEGGYNDETVTKNLDPSKSQELKVISRRGGHSIVMDDGDAIGRDQLIRIRTALGHQITMSDDGQTLMILHSNGQSYVELGKEGTVDIYSTNSFNVRTQGDLNLHADRNVNIHAQENLSIQAKNIQVNSEEDVKLRAGKNINTHALANFTSKTDGTLSMSAGGEASIAATGIAWVNGSKVNLNSGTCSTVPNAVPIITLNAQTDTLWDKEKGFIAAPAKLLSVTSRTPAHTPWANAGQGVDVKTSLNASSELPAAPSAGVQATNQQAAAAAEKPPAEATVASVPATNPISKAMDAGTTNAVMGAAATQAATGAAADAVKKGASVLPDSDANSCAVGSYGFSPKQLEDAGITKPGSSRIINAMANSTKNISRSMPSSVFSGAGGAENINQFARNVSAQTSAATTIAQKAQTGLTIAGVVSGREAAGQLAGLVAAASITGIANTKNAVKNIGTATKSTISSISSGQAAAGLAAKMGGLGGIQSALGMSAISLTGLVDQTRGVSSSAFYAIKSSFPNLKPGVPQNLSHIAKESAASSATAASVVPAKKTSLASGLTNLVKTGASIAAPIAIASLLPEAPGLAVLGAGLALNSVSSITGASNKLASAVSSTAAPARRVQNTIGTSAGSFSTASATQNVKTAMNQVSSMAGASSIISSGQLNQLPDAAAVVQKGAGAALSSQLASGVNAIPGGIKSLNSVINNAPNANNKLPGVDLGGNVADLKAKYGDILSKSGGLSSLAKSNIPAGAAAELEASISSLSGGSPGTLRLPPVSYNTVDRNEIAASVDSVIGDPKIPKPNLTGEIKEETVQSFEEELKKTKEEAATKDQQKQELQQKIDLARTNLANLVDSLPPGDPKIASAEKELKALTDELADLG